MTSETDWHRPPQLFWPANDVRFGPPAPITLYREWWSIRRIAKFHGRGYQSVRTELLDLGVDLRGHVTAGLRPMREDTKQKFRDRMLTIQDHPTRGKTGDQHPNYGKHIHSEQWLDQLRDRMTGTEHTPETRAKISEANRRWHAQHGPVLADPEAARRWSLANNIRPNRQELRLGELLDAVAPGRYRCNVHAETTIGGKIPDFVDDERREAIELYGDYWHRGQDPQDRIDLFAEHGWRTLVIWESELREPEAVAARVIEFGGTT